MIGLGNYYAIEIDQLHSLNYWHYVLYYACLKTLSHKHNSSIAKIMRDYGYTDISDPYVTHKIKKQLGYNRRIIVGSKEGPNYALLNYNEFTMRISTLRFNYRLHLTILLLILLQ